TAAALTLLGDAAKGWFAVWLAQRLAPGITPGPLAAVAVAAFLGHLYPIFLGFKGGKGVATALGVLVAIQPWLAVATAATWLIIAVFFRYSSLASLVAAFFAPVYYVFGSGLAWYAQPAMGIALAIIGVLLFYRHRANITRLVQGTESRIGGGKKK
ncbi:glycerol-3-phosphate acyltransferase, partial [Achromobacter xylosoxidans]